MGIGNFAGPLNLVPFSQCRAGVGVGESWIRGQVGDFCGSHGFFLAGSLAEWASKMCAPLAPRGHGVRGQTVQRPEISELRVCLRLHLLAAWPGFPEGQLLGGDQPFLSALPASGSHPPTVPTGAGPG